jgi:iron complex transport system substrate-binding protein
MGDIPAIKNDNFRCMEFQPFQATSYTTVHYIQGEGILATMLFPSVVSSSIPQIVTNENWISYLSWMDA